MQQLSQLGHYNLYLNGIIGLGCDEYLVSVRDGSKSAPLTLVIVAVVGGKLRKNKVVVPFRASVAQLMSAIESAVGTPAAKQTLIYRLHILRPEQSLKDLGVHDGDDVSLVVK
jgi:hypothetical protein